MKKQRLQNSKGLKIDFNQILPPETLDGTRSTEKMVIASILNHQQPDSDQLKICLDNELGAEDFSVPSLAMVYESMVNAYSESREEDFLVTILNHAHNQTEQNKNNLF